ncbi:MAG TPA: hypothetical protein VMR37_07060 [Rhabdochlamydiaceae bacterium]|nr:hypothetical protein [Rhabdochlamydiaceae bacterium]
MKNIPRIYFDNKVLRILTQSYPDGTNQEQLAKRAEKLVETISRQIGLDLFEKDYAPIWTVGIWLEFVGDGRKLFNQLISQYQKPRLGKYPSTTKEIMELIQAYRNSLMECAVKLVRIEDIKSSIEKQRLYSSGHVGKEIADYILIHPNLRTGSQQDLTPLFLDIITFLVDEAMQQELSFLFKKLDRNIAQEIFEQNCQSMLSRFFVDKYNAGHLSRLVLKYYEFLTGDALIDSNKDLADGDCVHLPFGQWYDKDLINAKKPDRIHVVTFDQILKQRLQIYKNAIYPLRSRFFPGKKFASGIVHCIDNDLSSGKIIKVSDIRVNKKGALLFL